MILLMVLNWFTSRKEFLVQFTDKNKLIQANRFWDSVDSNVFWLLIIMVVISLLWCRFYYKPYNNKPGRHYIPKHWYSFGGITFVVTFVASLCALCFWFVPNPKFDLKFLLTVSLINSVYSIIVYIILSYLFCKFSSTNAYRQIFNKPIKKKK